MNGDLNDPTLEELVREGFDALDHDELEEAEDIAHDLVACQSGAGYELLALIALEEAQPHEAIKQLRSGVEIVPEDWRLWQLLGNVYSDVKNYAKAAKAYDSGLACPKADITSLKFNKGVLLDRLGRYEESIALADSLDDPNMRPMALSLKMASLCNLKRYDEALAVGYGFLDEFWVGESGDAEMARFYTELGVALWEGKRSREQSLAMAHEALEYDRTWKPAFWLIREVGAETSARGRYYHLVLRGQWPESMPEFGKHPPLVSTSYQVVADNETEAVQLARSFEPEELRSKLMLEQLELMEENPGDLKGVYRRTPYSFFVEDSD